MKKILYIIVAIFLLTNFAKSQEIRYNKDGSVEVIFPTVAQWESYKKGVLFQAKDVETKDSLISEVYVPALVKAEQIIGAKDSALIYRNKEIVNLRDQNVSLLGEIIDLQTVRKPSIEWLGFYVGSGTGYYFADSIISKETIINSLWNSVYLTGRAQIRIKDFMLTGQFDIPLKSKPGIKLDITYRPF